MLLNYMLRKKYQKDKQSFIEVVDLGAGSYSKAGTKRSIAQIKTIINEKQS